MLRRRPSSPSATRRWPWLVLVLAIAALGFALLTALHQRETQARRGEMQATLFATELRDTVHEVTIFGHAVPLRESAAAVRPVVAATTRLADRRIAALDAQIDDPGRVGLLRAQLRDVRREAARREDPVLFAARLSLAAERMAATADDIAARQHARARTLGRESVAGGGGIVLLTLLLVAGVLERVQRLLLAASRRHAEQLRGLAERDALTGLANRRRLTEDLEALAPRASTAQPVQIVICDLDGFKQVNDRFGHAAGDELLAAFADRIRAAGGEDARAYRLGGDEFCIVSQPGRDVAERLQEAVHGRLGDGVTGSMGMALWPGEADQASVAMRLADDRMYAAKAARRGARAA